MRFYDAHNHLQDERFAGAQAQLVETARHAGVARMVVNGSCEEDWPQVATLARQFPQVLPSFGYHPWYLHERTKSWQKRLKECLEHPGSVVGEIGLDRWKPNLPYEGQEEAFTWQLRLAAERNVAASIHCLQAWGRLHDLLRDNPRPARDGTVCASRESNTNGESLKLNCDSGFGTATFVTGTFGFAAAAHVVAEITAKATATPLPAK